MARNGVVAVANPSRGMVAIKADDGGYTIIELLSDFELELGDRIAWNNDYGLGSETYQNLTRKTHDAVYVQNHNVSETLLRRQLLF